MSIVVPHEPTDHAVQCLCRVTDSLMLASERDAEFKRVRLLDIALDGDVADEQSCTRPRHQSARTQLHPLPPLSGGPPAATPR